MSFEDLVADWEARSGDSRSELSDGHLEYAEARCELSALDDGFVWRGFRQDTVWRLSYWRELFQYYRGFSAEATAICVREINRLRGK